MAVTNKIFIPTFISSINYEPVRTLPHIYFYNGLKDSEEYFIQHYPSGSTSSIEVSSQTKFPYLDYYDGLTPNSSSNSLLFFNELPAYGETPTGSLYTEYWDTYVSLLYNSRTRLFKASAIIPLADYFEMELNDIVQWRGNYYHLRAINDYNLKDGTCNIELLGPIIRDALKVNPSVCTFQFSSSLYEPASGGTTYDIWSGSYVYRMHEFSATGSASFQVFDNIDNVQIMVIGGGGYKGDTSVVFGQVYAGGGGGAGGFIYQNNLSLSTGSYNVVVGRGGDKYISRQGESGFSSSLSGPNLNISVAGGGGAGGGGTTSALRRGLNGASGGGGARANAGGLGILLQGNNGASGGIGDDNTTGGGGGGGYSQSGSAGYVGSFPSYGGGRGGHGTSIRFSPWMTLDWYSGGGNGTEVTIPAGYIASGSGNGTPNNMADLYRIGGGHGPLDETIPAGTGIVRIMYPYRTYDTSDTQTYRFTCNSVSGSLFGCKIQYVNTDGSLVDGEILSSSAYVDKVVPRDSQARITANNVLYTTNPGITYAESGGTIQVI